MPYNIEYHKDFIKFLKKHQDMQGKVFESFEQIAQNPYKTNLDIKKLQAKTSHYRLRIGKYRFLQLESEILIYAYKAESRGDIYK